MVNPGEESGSLFASEGETLYNFDEKRAQCEARQNGHIETNVLRMALKYTTRIRVAPLEYSNSKEAPRNRSKAVQCEVPGTRFPIRQSQEYEA